MKQNLRIVYTIPFFYPATRFGGPVTVLSDCCRELARRGHDVRVITLDFGVKAGQTVDRWVEHDGYNVWYVRTRRVHRVAPYFGRGIRRPLISEQALESADLLHMHVGLTYLNAVARDAASQLDVPYVYTPHGCLCPVRLRNRGYAKSAFMALFERRIMRDATRLHALTDKEKDDFVRLGADLEKIQVIPNGVSDMPADCSASEVVQFRHRLGIENDARLIVFLGRLSRIKGLELLADAFKQVRSQMDNVTLIVGGSDDDFGEQARQLFKQSALEPCVRFTGHLEAQQVLVCLKAADVFVLPSLSEGLPMAVLEACRAGVPVVITDRCNVPEVAEYGAGIVTVPSVDRISEALLSVLQDEPQRKKMAAQGERMIGERFSLEKVTTEMEKMYCSMVRRTAAKGWYAETVANDGESHSLNSSPA